MNTYKMLFVTDLTHIISISNIHNIICFLNVQTKQTSVGKKHRQYE